MAYLIVFMSRFNMHCLVKSQLLVAALAYIDQFSTFFQWQILKETNFNPSLSPYTLCYCYSSQYFYFIGRVFFKPQHIVKWLCGLWILCGRISSGSSWDHTAAACPDIHTASCNVWVSYMKMNYFTQVIRTFYSYLDRCVCYNTRIVDYTSVNMLCYS